MLRTAPFTSCKRERRQRAQQGRRAHVACTPLQCRVLLHPCSRAVTVASPDARDGRLSPPVLHVYWYAGAASVVWHPGLALQPGHGCVPCCAGRVGGYGLSLYGIELRPGATIVDVGSNIGNFAMWALVTLKVGLLYGCRPPVVGYCTPEAVAGHACNQCLCRARAVGRVHSYARDGSP